MSISRVPAAFIVALVVISTRAVALTNGPVQPEFTSFEPVDVTDMVNLPTGDFTYVLPLGDVKGPGGVGYPVVLSYHAGIQNDQEASWTGLGWTLNAGSIQRMARGFPDDLSKGQIDSYLHDQGKDGYSYNLGGGWGPIAATVGWTEKGFQGVTSISIGYGLGYVSVGYTVGLDDWRVRSNTVYASVGFGGVGASAGVTFGKGMAPTWFVSVGLSSRDGTSIASFSINSKGVSGFSIAGGSMSSKQFTSAGVSQWSSNFNVTIPLQCGFRIDFSSGVWGWNYTQLNLERGWGYLNQSVNRRTQVETYDPILRQLMPSATWGYYDAGAAPAIVGETNGGKDDMDKTEYMRGRRVGIHDAFNLPSQDVYMLSGQGISGMFKPITQKSMVTISADGDDYPNDGLFGRVDYQGNVVGYYNTAETKISPIFQDATVFKMIGEASLNLIDDCGNSLECSYGGDEGEGIVSKWAYENIDVNAAGSPQHVTGTRITPLFTGENANDQRISGFVITDQEGKTYWYTLPLYSIQQGSYTNKSGSKLDYAPYGTQGPLCNCSYRSEYGKYATTWLLTAITGPDYVKRALDEDESGELERLRPHQGDWGYWVSFRYEYGWDVMKNDDGLPVLKTPANYVAEDDYAYERPVKAFYGWRDPYFDNVSSEQYGVEYHKKSPCGDEDKRSYSSTYGIKEVTYLKSIETASEVAYFRTSERLDGMGLTNADYLQIDASLDPSFIKHYIADNLYYHEARDGGYWARQLAPIVPNPRDDATIGTWDSRSEAQGGQQPMGCMEIELPLERYPVEQMNQLVPGTKIGSIPFKGTIQFRINNPRGSHDDNKYRSTSGGVKLRIWWDPYGWSATEHTWSSSDARGQAGNPAKLSIDALDRKFGGTHEYYTTDAKCFDWKVRGDKLVLFVLGYAQNVVRDNGDTRLHRTALRLSKAEGDDDGRGYVETLGGAVYHIYRIFNIHPEVGTISLKSTIDFSYVKLSPYSKKLSEIVWYSKAQFPYLDPMSDPGEEGAMQEFQWMDKEAYPRSYRRTKFFYSYELAPGTTNSIDANDPPHRGGGRLTLKEVQTEAGPEESPVTMPPYLFDYQTKDANGAAYSYTSFENADDWGMSKDAESDGSATDPQFVDKTAGVRWNLKKIQLPSCGSISIDYERDHTKSVFGALYAVRKGNPCTSSSSTGSTGGLELEKIPRAALLGDYLTRKVWEYPYAGDSSKVKCEKMTYDGGDPKVGMYFIFNIEGSVERTVGSSYRRYGYYTFRVLGVEDAGSDQIVTFDGPISFKPPEDFVIEHWNLNFLSERDLYCDGLRTKTITTSTFSGTYTSLYEYPENGGLMSVLPANTIPQNFNVGWDRCWADGDHCARGFIRRTPFSNDPTENYTNGSTAVMYPWVQVSQVTRNGDNFSKVNGATRYTFWTTEDRVPVGSDGATTAPIIDTRFSEATFEEAGESRTIKLKQIVDRSAIVGMPKKVEVFDNAGNVVQKTENTYAFSEDMSSTAHDTKPGVIFNGQRLPANKPLGIVRERTFRAEKSGSELLVKTLSDVIVSNPYLIGTTEWKDGAPLRKSQGLFDAWTGGPMATVVNGHAKQKLEINVPYSQVLTSVDQSQAERTALKRKNMFSLPSASVVAECGMPYDLASILGGTEPDPALKKAGVSLYYCETVPGVANTIVPDQTRFWKRSTWDWDGVVPLTLWPRGLYPVGWRLGLRVGNVDQYTRPTMEMDGAGTWHVLVHHPYLGGVVAKIDNATRTNLVGLEQDPQLPDECSAFTGDYDDYVGARDYGADHVDDGYFDRSNGWEKDLSTDLANPEVPPTARVTTGERHFGNACVVIQNAAGVSRTFGISNWKTYVLSAWVKSETGVTKLRASFGALEDGDNDGVAETFVSSGTPLERSVAQDGTKWQLVKLQIPVSGRPADATHVKIWVGNRESVVTTYLDDIRFAPSDALVNTFFYDQQLGLPVAIVDPSNGAAYFKYDEFGRLVEKGKIED